jgi:glycosyltransferase involved in cell wall biosynthesis
MLRYKEADCLIFPSKLETWGMPITEFEATGKPILAIDLPYAHETVGEYAQAAFFPPGCDIQLAAIMREAASRGPAFAPAHADPIAQPFAENWPELWKMLLG